MTLKQFHSLGYIDEETRVVKTQPIYKKEDIEGIRLLPTGDNGTKKKPSTGKRGEHPKEYWEMKKPKQSPQGNTDYGKHGIKIEPREVAKSVISPVKPKVFKGPKKLGNKPMNIDTDLDFSKVVKSMQKKRPDLDFSALAEIGEAMWPTIIGLMLGAVSAQGRDPIATQREAERLARLGKK